MARVEILHNPRCSKSRATLELLRAHGVEPEIRLYLEAPPSLDELRALVARLGLPARAILRSDEAAYRESGLADPGLDDDALLRAIVASPSLLQRPVVIVGDRAAIGRPPENVLALLGAAS